MGRYRTLKQDINAGLLINPYEEGEMSVTVKDGVGNILPEETAEANSVMNSLHQEAPSALLTARSDEYGQSWLLSGAIIKAMRAFGMDFSALDSSMLDWPWRAILNKLTRVVKTPNHLDSWKDIEGYARLVREYIETGETYGNNRATPEPEPVEGDEVTNG